MNMRRWFQAEPRPWLIPKKQPKERGASIVVEIQNRIDEAEASLWRAVEAEIDKAINRANKRLFPGWS